MDTVKSATWFRRIDAYELNLCLVCNRASHRSAVRRFFALISRLGDGVFWYTLMAVLPVVYGRGDWRVSLQMAIVAIVGVSLYTFLKHRMVRERPFIQHAAIELGTAPLDRYSFPSGHTLHAMAFTTIAVYHHSELAWLLLPFASLVAASRVVLGLHYPSDVLAGAALGAALATGGLYLF